MEKMHELLPDCEKASGPSQHLQVSQWMESIDGKEKHDAFNRRMGETNSPPPKQMTKTAPIARKSNFNLKKQPQAQKKAKARKEPATNPYSQGYRIPKIQQDFMKNLFQMARAMMQFQKKEEAGLKHQK
ncbi:hypothetical protein O181_035705 [Austropuccinia psidii MF-1]|uniref:Uncharacterized protein n=1 Tax=Austropuccinia psidii MF-1 TaxID=1389203 RepID=A0A9Q3D579_9BASI|nr:hypothetical protein [Austropuccinia psidii MF-1]